MALITVFGASGRQGMAQVRQALKAGYDVRALSRQPDPFAGFDIEGIDKVEIRPVDLYDTDSYHDALEGSDYVFYTHPLQARADRAVLVGQVGAEAAKLGVKRVVWNTSSWIPDKPGEAHTYAGNTAGINALWRSGAPGTVFGSVLFMDNLLTNWARPFIVNEGRYVYPHNPELQANWISLDDVAKFMLASLERPDMEGAWLNIGGPERLIGKQVAQILSDSFGKPIAYAPCTPAEFGRYLVDAAGDGMPEEEKEPFAAGIAAFYEYNNTAPTRPFEVEMDHVYERFPELEGELEPMRDWVDRQDWSESNHRPAFG
ncbi:SDR family oxidoreductase [Tsuneonella mangrovi]|uniref:SDR family oxidoreductase n=1 Tax=Tsuneonella mangrovi TaxID=1982042 RepID=UPI001471FA15|nr:NmrA family NAD(P)-binding protein [Tsuneonella mangrovi]